MTMKENQSALVKDSRSSGEEADPLAFESKENYLINASSRGIDPLILEVKGGDGHWNPFLDDYSMDVKNPFSGDFSMDNKNPFLDDFSMDVKSGTGDFPQKEVKHGNGGDTGGSSSPNLPVLDLFGPDKNLYTDKTVLEYGQPEGVNYHGVKDICVDEGDKISIKGGNDHEFGGSFGQPLNVGRHDEDKKGDSDIEVFKPNNLAALFDDQVGFHSYKCENKEERDGTPFALALPEVPSGSSFDKDSAKICDLNDSTKTSETNSVTAGNIATDAAEKNSFADKTLPIHEVTSQSSLTSFLSSQQDLPVQISSGKSLSKLVGSGDEFDHKDGNVLDRKDADQHSDDISSKVTSKNVNEQSINHEDGNLDHIAFNESKGRNSINDVKPEVQMHEHKNSASDSLFSLATHDRGEMSFSAAGHGDHSGPLACSGSLSIRSDGSATSARSFAFPTLQTEWSGSPVRMARADDRKQKRCSWISGLFCCRF